MSGWKRVGKKTNLSWRGCHREIRIAISLNCTAANAAIADVKRQMMNLGGSLAPFSRAICEMLSRVAVLTAERERSIKTDQIREVFARPIELPDRPALTWRNYLTPARMEQEYTVEFLDRPHRRMSLDEILSPEEMRQIRRVSTVEQVNQVRQMLQERLRVGDRDISFRGEIGGRLEIRVVRHQGESDLIYTTDSADFRGTYVNADVERERSRIPPMAHSAPRNFTKPECQYYTGDCWLMCTVNPFGPCAGCKDYSVG